MGPKSKDKCPCKKRRHRQKKRDTEETAMWRQRSTEAGRNKKCNLSQNFRRKWLTLDLGLLLLSHFSRVRLCAIPETTAHQAPPSLGFSRQFCTAKKYKRKNIRCFKTPSLYWFAVVAWRPDIPSRETLAYVLEEKCTKLQLKFTITTTTTKLKQPKFLSRGKLKYIHLMLSVQFSSVGQSCPTLSDPMNHSTPDLPVNHQLPEFTETRVHRVSDAIQPSHPLSSPSPPAPNPSQHCKNEQLRTACISLC